MLALYMLAKMIPDILFSAYGGILADNANRRVVMIVLEFFSIILSLAPVFITTGSAIWILIVSTFLLTSAGSVFGPVKQTFIKEIASDLPAANALMSSGSAISMIVGSALGGVILLINTHVTFIINSATFAISLIIIATIAIISPAKQLENEADQQAASVILNPVHTFRQIYEAFITITKTKSLFYRIWLGFGVSLAAGGINVLLGAVAVTRLHSSPLNVGLVYASIGAGSLAGALVATRVMHSRMTYASIIGLATIFEGLFMGLFTQSAIVYLSLPLLFIGGVFSSIEDATTDTLIMEDTPDEMLGRFYSVYETTTTIGFALSTLLIGLLATYSVPVSGVIITAIWILSGVLWLVFTTGKNNKQSQQSLSKTDTVDMVTIPNE